MPDLWTDDTLIQALRDGLQAQPVPEITSDFDDRILLALRMPQPWYRRLWPAMRPVLLGACGSMAATLVLLHWAVSPPTLLPQTQAIPILASRPSHPISLENLLNRSDLHASSLMTAWSALPPKPVSKKPNRRVQIDFPLA